MQQRARLATVVIVDNRGKTGTAPGEICTASRKCRLCRAIETDTIPA
jgi:hypothetical protein